MLSLIYLMSEYVRSHLGVTAEINIYEQLSSALKAELMLYALGRYREHCIHVVDVCLVGHLILNSKVHRAGRSERVIDILSREIGISPERILRLWFVASLLHDIGYCWSIVEKVPATIYTSFPELDEFLKSLKEAYLEARESFLADTNSRIEFSINLERVDHGVVSALHLRNILESISESQLQEFMPAVRAITWHNVYAQSIEPRQYTDGSTQLAMLLILCDELQEWNRPIVELEDLATGFVSGLILPFPSEIRRAFPLESMVVNVEPEADFRLIGDDFKFILTYSPGPGIIDFVPSILWIYKTVNFKRVRWTWLFGGIKITMKSLVRGQRVEGADILYPEMELLQDFARNKPAWYLEGWFKEVFSENASITYNCTDDLEQESFSLILGGISGKDYLLRNLPHDFERSFRQWRSDYVLRLQLPRMPSPELGSVSLISPSGNGDSG